METKNLIIVESFLERAGKDFYKWDMYGGNPIRRKRAYNTPKFKITVKKHIKYFDDGSVEEVECPKGKTFLFTKEQLYKKLDSFPEEKQLFYTPGSDNIISSFPIRFLGILRNIGNNSINIDPVLRCWQEIQYSEGYAKCNYKYLYLQEYEISYKAAQAYHILKGLKFNYNDDGMHIFVQKDALSPIHDYTVVHCIPKELAIPLTREVIERFKNIKIDQ